MFKRYENAKNRVDVVARIRKIPSRTQEELTKSFEVYVGVLAEWLCSGLQIRGPRFDSGTRLHLRY
ncbi:protein of unknown function [Vibrio tapetis subsp. tapetis]|uniref:Uncharacterized protein n=1 Tax=Vibrio tapetis subsp. tapetis TaxID=1671868 RepID=A0A2N8Z925_9VIBR|nr:protein of unknown function [Vibrio tapetis subsp. tapetis]